MMRATGLGAILAATLAAACACKQNRSTGGGGGGDGGGGGGPGPGDPAACAALEAKVTGLYQEATAHTDMTPEEVRDNTAMVLAACRVAPDRVTRCVERVTTFVQLEKDCMPRLDDEGSEGLQFQGK